MAWVATGPVCCWAGMRHARRRIDVRLVLWRGVVWAFSLELCTHMLRICLGRWLWNHHPPHVYSPISPPHTHCLSLTVLSLFPPTPPHKQVTCASFHKASGLLVVGTSSGLFDMYQLPGFENLQKLSISRERVSSVAFNTTGGCLAGLLNGWCCYLVGGGSAARALCVLVCCVFGVFRVVGTGCCCRCCQACCKVQR